MTNEEIEQHNRWVMNLPKNKHGERVVYLHSVLVDRLKECGDWDKVKT